MSRVTEAPEASKTTIEAATKPSLANSGNRKHVKISSSNPVYYEDDTKRGLQLFNNIARLAILNPHARHAYLQQPASNRHWAAQGAPSLLWYECVSALIDQRTQLTLLRKLINQRYYTRQFHFKLQQFLALQREVSRDVMLYQSCSLHGETSKLPKINVLCKQIVSLLNDLDSCSVSRITPTLDRASQKSLSPFIRRYSSLYSLLTWDVIECIRTTRQLILNDIRFCYLFANFRSRVYSVVTHVAKFNDIAYHPVLAGREECLAITLDLVVKLNVDIAARYIARSYHHKLVSSHSKSLPLLSPAARVSETITSVQNCSVCTKTGHLLHSYCTGKCCTFLDAMSLMIQGAVDSRILATTDNCTSRTVEEALSRALTRGLYHQANSSVFYESRYSCGDKCSVVVHEQYCDMTRRSRRRWEDNFTTVVYACAQRGLPNSWCAVGEIPGFRNTLYKLDTSYYSVITCDHVKDLKAISLSSEINKDVEALISLIKLDKVAPGSNDSFIDHFNRLSYLVLCDSSSSREQVQLLLAYINHLNKVLHYLYIGYKRLLKKQIAAASYSEAFENMAALYQLAVYLESLHKQLVINDDVAIPAFIRKYYRNAIRSSKESIDLLKGMPTWAVDEFGHTVNITQVLIDNLPNIGHWKKDVHDSKPTACMVKLSEAVEAISRNTVTLPEPYITQIHYLLMNQVAGSISKLVVNNKKIAFSWSGVRRLENDVQFVLDAIKNAPVSQDRVLSTSAILSLRNDLNTLILKRKKSASKSSCGCEKQANWKRLSVPQLCSTCSDSSQLKPPNVNPREILSDSEVGGDSVTKQLRCRQKKHLKERLEITM